MGTKQNPGQFDCYEKALPDEPMFILLARDIWAPELVIRWAQDRKNDILNDMRPIEDAAKVKEALQCAADMKKWRDKHVDYTGNHKSAWDKPK